MRPVLFSLLLGTLFSTSASAYETCPTSTDWSQAAYPDFCGVQAALGASFGPSFYAFDVVSLHNEHLANVSVGAFSLGLSQVLGYSHWFYFQLRESFSYGYTFYGTEKTTANYPRRCERSLFFDGDARLFFPFRVAPVQRISLQPFIGFAIHQASLKGKPNPTLASSMMLKQRYLSPLFGLALGYNPTPKFALRSSLSMHIPRGKRAMPDQSEAETRDYHTLRVQRHGMGANLLALVKITPALTLTGEMDYFTYSSYRGSSSAIDSLYAPSAISCLSIKSGLYYQF